MILGITYSFQIDQSARRRKYSDILIYIQVQYNSLPQLGDFHLDDHSYIRLRSLVSMEEDTIREIDIVRAQIDFIDARCLLT